MTEGRIVIIPFLHGKLDADGSLVEPDIDVILEMWLQRHPQFRGREFHVIRAKMTLEDNDTKTNLVRVTVDFSPDLEHYDPTEDADLYEEFLADKGDSPPPSFHKIWVEQCEAAQGIEDEFGTQKALEYLVGEKFLNFLEAARGEDRLDLGPRSPEFRPGSRIGPGGFEEVEELLTDKVLQCLLRAEFIFDPLCRLALFDPDLVETRAAALSARNSSYRSATSAEVVVLQVGAEIDGDSNKVGLGVTVLQSHFGPDDVDFPASKLRWRCRHISKRQRRCPARPGCRHWDFIVEGTG